MSSAILHAAWAFAQAARLFHEKDIKLNAQRVLVAALCFVVLGTSLQAQSAAETGTTPNAGGVAASGEIHDVVGVVKRNHGRSADQAPFVLMDEAGQVIRYDLLPTNGVNLAALEGKKVAVSGAREVVAGRWLQRVRVSSASAAGESADSQVMLAAAQSGGANSTPSKAVTVAQAPMMDGGVIHDGVIDGGVISEGMAPSMVQGEKMGSYPVAQSYGAPTYGAGPNFPGYVHGQPPFRGPLAYSLGAYGYPPADDGVGPPHWYWVRAEYLMWFTKGMDLPPLVTTGTTTSRGVLGRTGTSVLYPDDDPNPIRSGGRIRFGTWLDPMQNLGVEGELLGVGQFSDDFFRQGDGSAGQIIARPFFNALTNAQDSQVLSFPNTARGDIRVETNGDFYSGGVRAAMNVCCCVGCEPCCDPCAGCGTMNSCGNGGGGCGFLGLSGASSVRLLAGYRFTRLNESVLITENLISLDTANPGSFFITDNFRTQNEFHGGDLGISLEARRYRWWLEMTGRIAFGNNRQRVTIDGSTQTTVGNNTTTAQGGILAQRTNIGTFERDDFTMIPELGANIGYQLTPRLSALVGYTFIYFPNVVRPGDIIDTTVNPNLFPPEEVPFTGPLRPEFDWRVSDFWAQGLNFGIDYRW